MNFNKLYPFLLLAIALISLYYQYQSHKKLSCDCKETGPITD